MRRDLVAALLAGAVLVVAAFYATTGFGAAPAPDAAKDARTHRVEISAFAFSPETLAVAAGDTVVWVNRDAVPHTASDVAGEWDSGSLGPGGEWRLAIGTSADVVCRFHPAMRGRILVR